MSDINKYKSKRGALSNAFGDDFIVAATPASAMYSSPSYSYRAKPHQAVILCRWLTFISSAFAISVVFLAYEIWSINEQLAATDFDLDICERKSQRFNEKLKVMKEDKTDLKAEYADIRNRLREEQSVQKQLTADLKRKNLALSETVSQIAALRELNQLLAQNLTDVREFLTTLEEEYKALSEKHKAFVKQNHQLIANAQQKQLITPENQLKVQPVPEQRPNEAVSVNAQNNTSEDTETQLRKSET